MSTLNPSMKKMFAMMAVVGAGSDTGNAWMMKPRSEKFLEQKLEEHEADSPPASSHRETDTMNDDGTLSSAASHPGMRSSAAEITDGTSHGSPSKLTITEATKQIMHAAQPTFLNITVNRIREEIQISNKEDLEGLVKTIFEMVENDSVDTDQETNNPHARMGETYADILLSLSPNMPEFKMEGDTILGNIDSNDSKTANFLPAAGFEGPIQLEESGGHVVISIPAKATGKPDMVLKVGMRAYIADKVVTSLSQLENKGEFEVTFRMPITLPRLLLTATGDSFERLFAEFTEAEPGRATKETVNRLISVVSLIGHLVVRKLVPIWIMAQVVNQLIGTRGRQPDPTLIRCVCELMQIIGKVVDANEQGKITQFLDRLSELADSPDRDDTKEFRACVEAVQSARLDSWPARAGTQVFVQYEVVTYAEACRIWHELKEETITS